MEIHEWYDEPFNAWFDGEIKDVHRGGKVAVKYADGSENLLDTHEVQAAIDVRPLAEWKRLVLQVDHSKSNRLTLSPSFTPQSCGLQLHLSPL